ncbi:histidine ammonia-lyase [bacterium]|nr:histidine ammonia-lyase [bacterium]
MVISVDGHSLTLELVEQVSNGAHVKLASTAVPQIEASRAWIARLEQAGANAPKVYGINTGFGSLKSEQFSVSDARRVSRNLIISHCSGTGEPFGERVVRAATLLRANALAQGRSGVRPIVIETLLEMLNRNVVPVVPSQGSLGASGDLAPLSHLAAVLSRDPNSDGDESSGAAWFNGEKLSGAAAMRKAGIPRLILEAKEGLALNNGVQFMSAVSALTLLDAERLTLLHDIALAMHLDSVCGVRTAFDSRIAGLRKYAGHQRVAQNVLRLLAGSTSVDSDPARIQDAYSLRCAPQIAGAVRDGLQHVRAGLEVEINSVTDNPLVFAHDNQVLSGGNFHGDPVGLRVDYMKVLLAELGNISERRISRLMDRHLNFGLPPYLAAKPGIESGLMMASYTAAALASENKVLAHPASVDSIPTSENQEDIVSMGTHGARQAAEILNNVQKIVAIELLCGAQALDVRRKQSPNLKFGVGSEAAWAKIRKHIRPLERDRYLADDIAESLELVRSGDLLREVQSAVEVL